jgi:hypothetical protein
MDGIPEKYRRVLVTCGIGLVCMTLFAGCSSQRTMALAGGSKGMDLTNESIGVFTLRTSNRLKPAYQPRVGRINVILAGSKKAAAFRVGKPSSEGKNAFYEYIISVKLKPGTYGIDRVIGGSGVPLLVKGIFDFPVGASFELPPNAIVYLGHVDMVNRERKEGERRSGGLLPLIDQAVTGYSQGTFDVTISDRNETDLPLFKQAYPALQDRTIEKVIMTKK